MNLNIEKYEDIPAHIRAAMSQPQRDYYQCVLNASKLGNQWITAHRQIEMQMSDADQRAMICGYFPEEALKTYDRFVAFHFRGEVTSGRGTESTLTDRVRHYYPELFPNLKARLAALFELPGLRNCRVRFELLEKSYYSDLAAAEHLARKLDSKPRVKRLHGDYRIAFCNVSDDLRDLLNDLVALGQMKRCG